uniref:Uncharacterized protein n=1 Tax=Anguilla anguilla TaxID=7936 RepID=A0A0E9T1C7_ANGAN
MRCQKCPLWIGGSLLFLILRLCSFLISSFQGFYKGGSLSSALR